MQLCINYTHFQVLKLSENPWDFSFHNWFSQRFSDCALQIWWIESNSCTVPGTMARGAFLYFPQLFTPFFLPSTTFIWSLKSHSFSAWQMATLWGKQESSDSRSCNRPTSRVVKPARDPFEAESLRSCWILLIDFPRPIVSKGQNGLRLKISQNDKMN